MVMGRDQLRQPDSEWDETFCVASMCQKLAAGTASPKNEPPKAPVRQPPCGKMAKKRVGYSLGGGLANFVRRTRNGATLCEAPLCAKK